MEDKIFWDAADTRDRELTKFRAALRIYERDAKTPDSDGNTLLHRTILAYAAEPLTMGVKGKKYPNAIAAMVSEEIVDIDINARNHAGHTPLMLLCMHGGEEELLRPLLASPRLSINEQDPNGMTAFHHLVQATSPRGCRNAIIMFSDKRLNVNTQGHPGGPKTLLTTPLLTAFRRRLDELIRIMIRTPKTDLNLHDLETSPLIELIRSTWFNWFDYSEAFDVHPDIDVNQAVGDTCPLLTAIKYGFGDICEWLLERDDLYVNWRYPVVLTEAVKRATDESGVERLKALIEHPKMVKLVNIDDSTLKPSAKVIRLLIKHGVDLERSQYPGAQPGRNRLDNIDTFLSRLGQEGVSREEHERIEKEFKRRIRQREAAAIFCIMIFQCEGLLGMKESKN